VLAIAILDHVTAVHARWRPQGEHHDGPIRETAASKVDALPRPPSITRSLHVTAPSDGGCNDRFRV
jgi:hypothetical protein